MEVHDLYGSVYGPSILGVYLFSYITSFLSQFVLNFLFYYISNTGQQDYIVYE